MNIRRQAVLLFGLAFTVRVALVVALHPYHDLTRYELQKTAISLATTGGMGIQM
ncbi:MAG: hypothetical protein ACRD45_23465 [Bryobacteraceae bacterium]